MSFAMTISIQPMVLTCPARADSLAETLRLWRETDWPADPTVVVDDGDPSEPRASQTANALRLLESFDPSHEYLLFLEDDLDFALYLWHSLQTWPILRARDLQFGSLYHSRDMAHVLGRGRDLFIPRLEHLGGSQALLIRRDLVAILIQRWKDSEWGDVMQDLRMFRILARHNFSQGCPGFALVCHDPPLIQHRPEPSTWHGPAHQCSGFDKSFRRAQHFSAEKMDT